MANYIIERGQDGLKSIRKIVAAISEVHRCADLQNPCDDPFVIEARAFLLDLFKRLPPEKAKKGEKRATKHATKNPNGPGRPPEAAQ